MAILEKEWWCDTNFSVRDLDFFGSTNDFFDYLLLNHEGFLGSYWRYFDESGKHTL